MQPDAPAETPSSPIRPSAPALGATTWGLALGAALLAGVVGWACGEKTTSLYKPVFVQPPNWGKMNHYDRADYVAADQIRQKPVVDGKNVALVFGVLGAALGGLLGVAGALARKAPGAGLVAAGFGGVAGAALGAAATAATVPIFYRYLDPEMSILVPALTHLVLFGAVGAAGGLGLGLGLGGRGMAARAVVGGILGGMIAAVAYDITASLVFPSMRVYDPVPKEPEDRLARLVMHVMVALLIGVFATLNARSRGKHADREIAGAST